MSTDWLIHLKDETFPEAEWQEVLRAFNASENSPTQWNIQTKEGSVWLDITRLKASSIYASEFNWQISIGVSGLGAHKYWTAYSIGYWCLALMKQASFLDPNNDERLATPEELEEYADGRLKARNGLSTFAKMGLLDGNERVQLAGTARWPRA